MGLGLGFGVQKPSRIGGFSLTNISGLTAWYKFNEGITTSGTTVLTWDDSSGNNRTMGNITATNKRPEFDSSDNTVDFSTDKYLELNSSYGTDSDFPNTNAFTAFLAVRIPFDSGTTKINSILFGGTTSDNVAIGNLSFLTGSYYSFGGNGSDANYIHTTSTETTYPHVNNELFVFAIRRIGTSLQLFRNSRSNSISQTTESNTTATADFDILGTTSAGGSNVSIAEVAVYNSGLSDADFDLVIDDIKTRVGI